MTSCESSYGITVDTNSFEDLSQISRRTGLSSILLHIESKRHSLFGHVRRLSPESSAHKALPSRQYPSRKALSPPLGESPAVFLGQTGSNTVCWISPSLLVRFGRWLLTEYSGNRDVPLLDTASQLVSE